MTEHGEQSGNTNHEEARFLLRLWQGFLTWLRRDGLVILLFALTTVLMTYPLAFKLGGEWLALRNNDTYMKLWDNWWLQTQAFNGPSLFFTDQQFHPLGVDLSYHSISWSVAFLAWGLTLVSDAITAYNVTILVAIFATAYAAYLLVQPFAKYRAAAWLTGAIYAFAPYLVAHAGGHPDLVHLAPIPLAVLLLYRALTRPSLPAAIGAALMVGLAALTSLYIMVFCLLTVGPVFLFLLLDKRRWSSKKVRPAVLTFLLASVLLLSIRLAPIFRNSQALAAAIEQKDTTDQDQADLLSYFLPSPLNPIFAPISEPIAERFNPISQAWPAYLGLVPLALTILALTWKKQRKFAWLWFSIGLLFLILSLGPSLRFNGALYENIALPLRYLTWFPPLRAVGRPSFYVIGVLLPLAVLAALGFDRLLTWLEGRRGLQITLMIVLPGILLVEFWSGPFPGVPAAPPPFYRQLAVEAGDFAIIELPMGRHNSKPAIYYQTVHEKKIGDGLVARTPAEAYQYIHGNPLLQQWSQGQALEDCSLTQPAVTAALDALIDDDFRYVIARDPGPEFPFINSPECFVEPFYQDGSLKVYRLSELRQQPYEGVSQGVYARPSPANPASITWEQRISLLGYDLAEPAAEDHELVITFYWQALENMELSYKSYFHLVDPNTGAIVAQVDQVPRSWRYPTQQWQPGEVVQETVRISLDAVPSGDYELQLGWYPEAGGGRLAAVSEDHRLLNGGSILLTVIER